MFVADQNKEIDRYPSEAQNPLRLRTADAHLREALALVTTAGAPKTAARIRQARSSINGAIRHAELAMYREARRGEARTK